MNRTKTRQIVSLILAIVMMLPLVAGEGAFAAVNADARGKTEGYGSNGKFLAPILPIDDLTGYIAINSLEALESIGKNSSYPLNGKYYLASDMDFAQWMHNGTRDWEPIGTQDDPFTGTLDGRGHCITGLEIIRVDWSSSGPMAAGLFGYAQHAAIKNLGVENVKIDNSRLSGSCAGALVGSLECGDSNSIAVSNCYVTGAISSSWCSGGLIGMTYIYNYVQVVDTGLVEMSVTDCANYANTAAKDDAGGIIGHVCGPCHVKFTRCFNYGDIDGQSAGGIIGYCDDFIDNYIITKDGSGNNDIIYHGQRDSSIVLTECENHGSINGEDSSGGMIGYLDCLYILMEKIDESVSASISVLVEKCLNTGRIKVSPGNWPGPLTSGGMIGGLGAMAIHYSRNEYLTGEYQPGEYDLNELAIDVRISDCRNEAFITGSKAGGMVGYADIDARSTELPGKSVSALVIEGCTNDGKVLGGNISGGIVGHVDLYSYDWRTLKNLPIEALLTIQDCSNNADIATYGKIYFPISFAPAVAGGIAGLIRHNACDDVGTGMGRCETNVQSSANYGNVFVESSAGRTGYSGGTIAYMENKVTAYQGFDSAAGSVSSRIAIDGCSSTDDVYGVTKGLFGCSDAFVRLSSSGSPYDTADYPGIDVKTTVNGEDVTGIKVTGTLEEGSKMLHFDGDETRTAVVPWNEASLFKQASTGYNADLAYACSVLSAAAYNGNCDIHDNETKGHYIEEAYRSLGFADETIMLVSYPGHPKNQLEYDGVNSEEDELAFAIGNKPITIDGVEYNLILVTLRGAASAIDWAADAVAKYPGMPAGEHYSFLPFRDKVLNALGQYVAAFGNMSDKGKNKILVTGHSLGAGAANLVAAQLADTETYALKNNIYAYTIASPNPVDLESFPSASVYYNIFNIVNPCDWATGVPWGHWKFGQTLVLPGSRAVQDDYENTQEYKAYLAQLMQISGKNSSETKRYAKSGTVSLVGPHDFDAYVAWMKSKPARFPEESPGKYVNIKGPADIEVYDGTNTLVCRTVGGACDQSLENDVFASVDEDGGKHIWLPGTGRYRIVIKGTGTGVMEYSVQEVDWATGPAGSAKGFIGVALYGGKTMISQVGGGISAQDTQLFVVDNSGFSTMEVLADGTETSVENYKCGDVDGNGRVAPMDATLLSRYLAGWPGVVINRAAADVDGDGEITPFDLTILQRHIAGWPGYEVLPYSPGR
ncbi:MAG: dockerin type I domain-containing protein [Clostridiales bacterium]|nr:dockerin type I domain-containing protein [Clostridiales bacterium]